MTNTFKPFGGILLVIGTIDLVLTMMAVNSGAYQGSPLSFLWNVAVTAGVAITGVVLLTADPPPRLFQLLSRKGLVVFVILAGILPVLCWVPWLIPGLKRRAEG
jgi:hypothetical protein